MPILFLLCHKIMIIKYFLFLFLIEYTEAVRMMWHVKERLSAFSAWLVDCLFLEKSGFAIPFKE